MALGRIQLKAESQVVAAALHQYGAVEIQHQSIGCVPLAAPEVLQSCAGQGELQDSAVALQGHAYGHQPVGHVQADLVPQCALGHFSQWSALAKPLQLAFDAAKPQL